MTALGQLNSSLLAAGVIDYKELGSLMKEEDMTDSAIHPSAFMKDITVSFEESFASDMNLITQDFTHHFMNLKSILQTGQDTTLIKRYYSHKTVVGALSTFIEDDLSTGHSSYNAYYPGSTLPEYAIATYDGLVYNVGLLNLPCCILTKNEELVEGHLRRQKFTSSPPEGISDVNFRNMVVEVSIQHGEVPGTWTPVLEIYEK